MHPKQVALPYVYDDIVMWGEKPWDPKSHHWDIEDDDEEHEDEGVQEGARGGSESSDGSVGDGATAMPRQQNKSSLP